MAIAQHELKHAQVVLTYEDYLREGETPGRYEIIDGVREWMTNATLEHNLIATKILNRFLAYEESFETTIALPSPLDIITKTKPLKVRQPDTALISRLRFGDRQFTDPSPLQIAPELVVEVLSPSESKRTISQKMTEYAGVLVKECWIIHSETQTLEQWALSRDSTPKWIATFSNTNTVTSLVFNDLAITLNSIFRLRR